MSFCEASNSSNLPSCAGAAPTLLEQPIGAPARHVLALCATALLLWACVSAGIISRGEGRFDDGPTGAALLQDKINPNTAAAPSLTRLPNIGPALAQAIIKYRQQHATSGRGAAPFRRPEDLDAVKGIGPATIADLTPHLWFSENLKNN